MRQSNKLSTAPGANPTWLRADGPAACVLDVSVVPGAKRSELAGLHDGALRIKLAAPPVDGKANAALEKLLAQWLDLPQRDVQLLRGQTSRRKTLRVQAAAETVQAAITARLPARGDAAMTTDQE
ncbi:hypothetical protein BurJ1DRAFT_4417 [Burkholderiales bacterium JOSHI_001]|nr:hypothetical protein BurJ1DRAFT_4417 [Burkholderiales bacterium JOSHI_001]